MKTLHEIASPRPYPNVPLWTENENDGSSRNGHMIDAWVENDRPFALWRGGDSEYVIYVYEWRQLGVDDFSDIASVHSGHQWTWGIWNQHYVTDTYL